MKRSGTALVLLFALFAALAYVAFRVYGERALEARGPDTPVTAVRELVESDNTLVGLLGGIRRVEPIEVVGDTGPAGAGASVSAVVVGGRDSARVYVDLAVEEGRWVPLRSSAVLMDGRRLPPRGSPRPRLEPVPAVRRDRRLLGAGCARRRIV
ncbi:MAG TPA: hypothetical protein VJP59_00075 [Gemmatimonadota bacterium]|nr:hypothetical protein [Gemmatimonadota bacterium]